MTNLTRRVREPERSSIRVMYDLAESHDGDLVRLEVGEPDFDTPAHVVDAALAAARDGDTHYTPNAGTVSCRRAISGMLAERDGLDYGVDELCVTVGGMEALLLAVLATVGPGEELIAPGPTWPNYETQAALADGTFTEVEMPAETGYDLDPDLVVDAMSDDTAAVVLTTPNNPTGRTFDPEDCQRVVDAAADHDAFVIADEVYLSLAYDDQARAIAEYADQPEHVLTVGSCSKAYAMTGWRLGWLAGDADLLERIVTVRESTTACPSSVAQAAAVAALTGPQEPFEEMYAAFEARRDLVYDRIQEIEGVSCPRPEAAFYVFLDPGVDDALALAKYLLREHGVVLAPGSGFGAAGEGRLRLSFANSMERLDEGLDRLEAGLRAY
ncbi:aminotransferase class I/II-fold pyridoxal phosphate-dependent enzyme [Halorubellus sp. JP-L1]|uniref:pyridoxal phosphate-dependent aminotransferase n=1 Tax=Halorubellus sp. JP-L1 TaxID=2715753 RepID=UPI00140DD7F4|nr:aminotransferase class I/II-fold pyridoxal phosphate-dependent enzyme [Halorubellus sp. JP-L1]NHN43321.1 aminotransferase class I/II-fold pyridoxal phosphate-dependent enzyme [Halorubellus sp. JP-L1]